MPAHQIAADNSIFFHLIAKILSHKTDFLTLLVSFLSLVVSAMSWRATNGQMKIAENQYKISLYEKRMERFESYCNKVQEVASILDQPLATTALKDILHDCMRVFYSQFEKDSPIGIAIDACMTYNTMNLLYKRKCFSYQEREREISDINNIAKITKKKNNQ
ncbi:hypothetical protein [Acetobacter nitrogenifigens]|nr:hypothetical protein [Acetobacter nitrogenifigens]